MSDEAKVCEVTYKIKLEWADTDSEEIAAIASSIICCSCINDDSDNGNNGNN